jgi:flagellar motor switch protein FliG
MMNRMLQNERERQLRKAAILVASLDDALAERMLADLPPDDAQAVRTVLTRLDAIDPEEQSDVVDQFRRSSRVSSPHRTEGVELDASLLARFEQPSSDAWETSLVKPPVESLGVERPAPWETLSDAEAETIVDALSQEHPQTIAVVISRLEHVAAAKLLSKLSPSLQTEVLGRLAELDPADEHSIKVVESHLAQWIHRQRERKQRLAAGVELVARILQSTPAGERTVILTRLGSSHPDLARRIGQPTTVRRPSVEVKIDDRPNARYKPLPKPTPPPLPSITDPLGELERLDDATLMTTLTQAERQTVMLALAGASEELMSRIVHRLPRRQAKQFRRQLRSIGPTRLSDMFAAQQELARHARQLKSR